VSDYPTARLPVQRVSRPRRRRWPAVLVVVLVILLALLVVADRVAVAYADNQFATQVKNQGGLSAKPKVNIEGFPFLTQLAARRFNEVQLSAASEQAGPVAIDNLQATMHGMQLISGFTSARVASLSGTGLITFASLASAANVPGLTISALNGNEAKVSVDLGVVSGSGVARVTKVGSNKINIAMISAGGIPLSALGNLSNMTITVPGLPIGITLQSIGLTAQGILVHITGTNVTLSGG
jgi:hypothetical protein